MVGWAFVNRAVWCVCVRIWPDWTSHGDEHAVSWLTYLVVVCRFPFSQARALVIHKPNSVLFRDIWVHAHSLKNGSDIKAPGRACKHSGSTPIHYEWYRRYCPSIITTSLLSTNLIFPVLLTTMWAHLIFYLTYRTWQAQDPLLLRWLSAIHIPYASIYKLSSACPWSAELVGLDMLHRWLDW